MVRHVAHLDADSFYVSAERVRHPELLGKPVGVLGNKGACVIGMCAERCVSEAARCHLPLRAGKFGAASHFLTLVRFAKSENRTRLFGSEATVCTAVALASSELPLALLEEGGLEGRVHDRGGEKEIRFYWQANPTLLPVWLHGQLRIVRWGNKDRAERKLPPTGWTWQETIEEGRWSALEPEPVVIPASFGLMNGVVQS